MTLSEAIASVETSQTALASADAAKVAAQAKFDAAQANKASADADDLKAATDFNSSLDALIEAATAAKVPPPPQP